MLQVLEKACELCEKAGAKQAKMLNVSGAFHTPYMEAAGAALSKVLDEADIKMPSIKVYSNVTGKPYTSVPEIKQLLKRQLLEPVRWEQGTKDLVAGGHSQYIEPGPGKQLKAMMRRIDPDAWSKSAQRTPAGCAHMPAPTHHARMRHTPAHARPLDAPLGSNHP